MTRQIRVLLADDHPLIRAGIRTILTTEPDVRLVGEAIDGTDAQHLCRTLQPDVLLLDLNMPGPSPAETVAVLRTECPAVHVLVLTAHDDDAYVRALVAAGVDGYVLKDDATEAVVRAIHAVMQGDTWFSRPVMDKLARPETRGNLPSAKPALTAREMEVLRLVVAARTNQEIARALGISVKTVEKHLAELFTKLRVASRVEAAVLAVREQMI
jgi:DNA-binding NarL/FixJ family response regulator